MKKKQIKNILILLSVVIVLLVLTWGSMTIYKNLKRAYLHPYHAIPENAILLVRTTSIENLWNEILPENDLFMDLKDFESFLNKTRAVSKADSIIRQDADVFELFSNNEFYISLHNTSENSIQALYVLPYTKLQEKRLSKSFKEYRNDFEEKYKETSIYRFSGDSSAFYYIKQGVLAISFSSELLKSSIDMMNSGKRIDEDHAFYLVDKTSGKKVDISFYVHYKRAFEQLKSYFTDEHLSLIEQLQSTSEWLETDLHIRKKIALWNGYSSFAEKESYLNVFKNQSVGNYNFLNIAPKDLIFFAAISFSESSVFIKQLQKLSKSLQKRTSDVDKTDFWSDLSISQIANVVYQGKDSKTALPIIIAKPIDPGFSKDVLIQSMESISDSSSYLGFTIGKTDLSNSARCFSPEIFNSTKIQSFAIIDSFLVFASEISEIKNIIDGIVNVNVFTETMLYAEMSEYANTESNLFIFCAIADAQKQIMSKIKEEYQEHEVLSTILKNTAYASIQFGTANNDLMMTSAFLKYESSGVRPNEILVSPEKQICDSVHFEKKTAKKIWEINVPNPILNAQLITDPSEDYFKVAIIDKKSNMILLDHKGTKLWQIKLKDYTEGKITMVDYYKNGKWQMYFNSPSSIYLIDKLGRPVGKTYPYPFRVLAANHGTIIDINNKKDYRAFFININRQISCIDLNTSLVSTWKMHVLNRPSSHPIQAEKVNGRWILSVIDNEENIHFLNLDGIPPFSVQKSIPKHHGSTLSFIDEPQAAWYYMSKSGFLVKILADGKVVEQKLPISDIPYTFTKMKCATTKSNMFVVSSDKNIYLISPDLTQVKTIAHSSSPEKTKISSQIPSVFTFTEANENTIFNIENETMYDFRGKVDLLKTNNVKNLINFQGSKISLWEIN
ncbi:MAG: hypothetical protein RBS19_08560 [Bacteroidales bacterium]|nr:hypothetical protein [Bacteroidales bacterium]